MSKYKEPWQDYVDKLTRLEYTQEQIEKVKEVRESDTHEVMTFEQFRVLFLSGVVKRTAKLKQPRNLYVSQDGDILFLNHFNKRYIKCGYFK